MGMGKMSSYLIDKFKGKYSLQAEIDKSTGDFCRDKNGNLENYNDIWIECYGKGRVFHYGKNVLTYYCESKQRGKNIITAINELDKDLIFDIEETDSEVLFKFKANNIEKIEQFIKPKTTSADRSLLG
jgi:mRNA degradation ribonuclease J1/J2